MMRVDMSRPEDIRARCYSDFSTFTLIDADDAQIAVSVGHDGVAEFIAKARAALDEMERHAPEPAADDVLGQSMQDLQEDRV